MLGHIIFGINSKWFHVGGSSVDGFKGIQLFFEDVLGGVSAGFVLVP